MIQLAVLVTVVTALLGTCAYVGRTRTWGSWLSLLRFSGVNSSRPGHASGIRIEEPVELSYSGGGKVELGDFSIRIFDPITRTTLKSDFQLEGTAVTRDEGAFQKFMRNNRRFFREQVTVALGERVGAGGLAAVHQRGADLPVGAARRQLLLDPHPRDAAEEEAIAAVGQLVGAQGSYCFGSIYGMAYRRRYGRIFPLLYWIWHSRMSQ